MVLLRLAPEKKAREIIDKKLIETGWIIQDYKDMDLTASEGVVVREYPTETGPADYILFLNNRPAGVIEAKSFGTTLTGVHEQTQRYSTGKLKHILNTGTLPFLYESTGIETYFTDTRDPFPRQRFLFSFHRPETLAELVKKTATLRARLRGMPSLQTGGLRTCQVDAVNGLEHSFAENRPRSLIHMATGAGKTYTAITSTYRLLKFAGAKKILFLVDTRNLGKQAEQEFRAYKPTDDKRSFTELYNIQRLLTNAIDPSAQVCISTIQRMYSILKGEDMDENLEDESLYSLERTGFLTKEIPYNPNIPVETFDFVIIDECHRSIYKLWKQVLDYFDAFLIGLTATPDARTYAFFNENVVSEYTYTQAVADNVNVSYDIYTIETEITRNGSRIRAREYVDLRNKMTRRKQWKQLEDELTYDGPSLDRKVVNPSQIRNIIRTYREQLFTEMFPERKEVPKTLIFAKTDSHAEDIVNIAREEFGEGNDFCKKITYNTGSEDPDTLLSSFRNDYYPRIAVTVDMIATGTDVKPLEVLIFMRDVRSRNYFQQMVGRGTRTLSKDDLQKVSASARTNKSRFIVIDAVGVFQSAKLELPPFDRQKSLTLKELMIAVAGGKCGEDMILSLAARLTKLDKEITPEDRTKIKNISGGKSLSGIVAGLIDATDPDTIENLARKKFNIPENAEPDKQYLEDAQQELITAASGPFKHPALRDFLVNLKTELYQVIDNSNIDKILYKGFDSAAREKAEELIVKFREFLAGNRDKITALKILYTLPYNKQSLSLKMINELYDALHSEPWRLDYPRLWKAYELTKPKKVKSPAGKLTDIISLVRFESGIDEALAPFGQIVNKNFKAWVFRKNAGYTQFTPEQMEWLRMIKDHIITSVKMEKGDFNLTPFSDKGGLGKMWQLFGSSMDELINEINKEMVA